MMCTCVLSIYVAILALSVQICLRLFLVCAKVRRERERERGREQNKKMNFLNEWQMLRASKFVSSYVLFLTTNNNSTIAVKSESNPDWLSTQSRENVRLFFCRSLALPHFLSRKYQLLQINRLQIGLQFNVFVKSFDMLHKNISYHTNNTRICPFNTATAVLIPNTQFHFIIGLCTAHTYTHHLCHLFE